MNETVTTGHWDAALQAAEGPGWLQDVRRRAFERFQALGFPHPKDEDWKYSDLRAVRKGYPLAAPGDASFEDIGKFMPGEEAARIVFVDGHHAPGLGHGTHDASGATSDDADADSGFTVAPLADHLDEARPGLEAAAEDNNPFTLLNTALWQDGAFVSVPAGGTVSKPIHVVYVQTGRPTSMRHVRTVVHAGAGSEATVLESHIHIADEDGLTNAATYLTADRDASLRHVKVQKEDRRSHHVADCRIHQHRDSRVHSVLLNLGAEQSRQSITAALAEQNAQVDLEGVFFGQRTQRVDIWTKVDHMVPHCRSKEVFKGILDDASRGAFTGNVLVREGAVKTRSDQENRNLLLSDKAHVDTTPQLEIFNDDVQCAHGSTIGQLDDDQVFFLRSRGIGKAHARMMLTRAFASDVIGSVSDAGLRTLLDKYLHVWFIKHTEHLR